MLTLHKINYILYLLKSKNLEGLQTVLEYENISSLTQKSALQISFLLKDTFDKNGKDSVVVLINTLLK